MRVFLNGRLVGALRRDISGVSEFRYADEWLAWQHAMPISLSLPLRSARYVGDAVAAVFDNLLPDDGIVRNTIGARVHAAGSDTYSLLAAIGRDCVGALQFLPEGADVAAVGEVAGRPITDAEIARLITSLRVSPLGLGDDDDFRISIAGAQEKTALLSREGQWFKPIGTTATTHILKPQIGVLPNGLDLSESVENEYFCLKLTAALGLPSAKAEIATFGSSRVLVVERFDRLWTQDGRLLRVPQEDCCQALSVPPTQKYQSDGGPGILEILALLEASDTPDLDRMQFLKATLVFWLLAATDGHAKNFSLFLYPGGRFRLAPLYDVISAQPSADAGLVRLNKLKLAMSVGDRRHYVVKDIVPRHFLETASRARCVGAVEQAFAEILEAMPPALDDVIAALPERFPGRLVASIDRGIRARLRLLAA